MSHTKDPRGEIEGVDDTFLVIFKVYGDAIHLWPRDKMQQIGKTHSFTIACHNVEAHSDEGASNVRVFVLPDPSAYIDNSVFEDQLPAGRSIEQNDMAIFMTGPMSSSSKASYAIDIGLHKRADGHLTGAINTDTHEAIGAAYLYLVPKFATQGIQRTPIIARRNHVPIGQIQVEYLIVTNPIAYGRRIPRPDWILEDKILAAGHRGAGSGCRSDVPGGLLENTVASFNYAHRNGADMCELDVLVSADGIPVVYHNFDVNAIAAQQPNEQSGKFGVQVNQLTYKQLRDFRLLAMKDAEGSQYTLDVPNQKEDNRPFPTLEQVLKEVDIDCSLNIELKWAQMLPNGKNEATQTREINDFVDRILKCIFEHNNGRAIVLSTFSADIAILLRLKQSTYPVLFLTTGDSKRFNDPTTKTIKNAIHFAQAFDLAGVNPNVAHLDKHLVNYAKDRGLLVYAWGKIESTQAVRDLKSFGLNGAIYDRVDLIKPHD